MRRVLRACDCKAWTGLVWSLWPVVVCVEQQYSEDLGHICGLIRRGQTCGLYRRSFQRRFRIKETGISMFFFLSLFQHFHWDLEKSS
jgi:hypothetical protein